MQELVPAKALYWYCNYRSGHTANLLTLWQLKLLVFCKIN